MRRRQFITLLGCAAAWPLAARAQQLRRIGVLMNGAESEEVLRGNREAFVQTLRTHGWVDGQNLRIDVRWNDGIAERARARAAELVGLVPEVLFSASTTNLMALMRETRSIPIVFVQVSDPVVQGFVPGLTRPGGHITGFAAYEFSVGSKWVDLLKQMSPGLARIGVMFNPNTSPQTRHFLRAVEGAASALGVMAVAVEVREEAQIEPAIAGFAREPNGGLLLPTDSFTRLREQHIAELALHHRLPSISASADFASAGGLMFYGVGTVEHFRGMFRQAAGYVDRILRGAKPGDLPVQLPTKYHLAINLKVAKALGLDVPMSLLLMADEQIE
jgi:putative ABC transport system substrate-binding protein